MTQEEELNQSIEILSDIIDFLKKNSNNYELISIKLQQLRDAKIDLILLDTDKT